MFTRVLVANRGPIAARIIRTLQALGIEAVAVFAESDASAPFVSAADHAFSLGPGGARDTYLDIDKLLQVAHAADVQAVHPGYGFLSESAAFAEALSHAGICFIGPTTEQMAAFGRKHTARALAARAGVPLVPGTDLLANAEAAQRAAAEIGYPVMPKSTAGGGGIGMQRCDDAQALLAAWDSAARLAASNFGDAGLFIERLVIQARHVEVQAFGDGRGGVLILGDRDCSVQRRNQKVIEEAPAPNLPEPLRAAMHSAARRLLAEVNYANAGTVEFMYDAAAEAFYFLEVNTRLQVEHGVTEEIFGVDLVQWQVRQAAAELPPLAQLEAGLEPKGAAVQARLYAEDPLRAFMPCSGTVTALTLPSGDGIRVEHSLAPGLEVNPSFDPMLAKIIASGPTRQVALARLEAALAATVVQGPVTNLDYLRALCAAPALIEAPVHTRFLESFTYRPACVQVMTAGAMTSLQDWPGRTGYWAVGVPPSGPFDSLALRLGNRLLGNAEGALAMEITLQGPVLKFHSATVIALTGAPAAASLDGQALPWETAVTVAAGAELKIGTIETGARAYLAVAGGFQAEPYLGSAATFTLGRFGGYSGRALQVGDQLWYRPQTGAASARLPAALYPKPAAHVELRVIPGPHAAPDFFTDADMDALFAARWQVHYNSSRTGVRLIGPKPSWARPDGGEAGLHPSNIHDTPYAIGSVDFTGDMPVILGPDGPSLGGFVCPAVVITADLWKLGQLRAGASLSLVPVTLTQAAALREAQDRQVASLDPVEPPALEKLSWRQALPQLAAPAGLNFRCAGDANLLVEYGAEQLDLQLRVRVQALLEWLEAQRPEWPGLRDLTPGVRALQIHFDPARHTHQQLAGLVAEAELALAGAPPRKFSARVVHLPLCWDDPVCREAALRYEQSVRRNAPWCPDNIEFIRRINGLPDIDAVKATVLGARYLVLGLGDVYLGAPLATPVDPRHRLVTTKYNPARTWTAENSVGIGGAYLCVYGMEGPGGYQLVGRTVQMWHRYGTTDSFPEPWLLRFFDQIQFYEVSAEELARWRRELPAGRAALKIEPAEFDPVAYGEWLTANASSIDTFTQQRRAAFDAELGRWRAEGQFTFSDDSAAADAQPEAALPEGAVAIASPAAGSMWQLCVAAGDQVTAGQALCVLESMKMELAVPAPSAGRVLEVRTKTGAQVAAGETLVVLEAAS